MNALEQVARAICEKSICTGGIKEGTVSLFIDDHWRVYRGHAQAAIQAHLKVLLEASKRHAKEWEAIVGRLRKEGKEVKVSAIDYNGYVVSWLELQRLKAE